MRDIEIIEESDRGENELSGRKVTTHENCQPCLRARTSAISLGVSALLLTLASTFPHRMRRESAMSWGWSFIPFFGKARSGRPSMRAVEMDERP